MYFLLLTAALLIASMQDNVSTATTLVPEELGDNDTDSAIDSVRHLPLLTAPLLMADL